MSEVKNIKIKFEGKETTIGQLSKNDSARLIASLLYQRQEIMNILFPHLDTNKA